jgi:hypothetical protein
MPEAMLLQIARWFDDYNDTEIIALGVKQASRIV